MDCPPSVVAALSATPFDARKLVELLFSEGLRWVNGIVYRVSKARGPAFEDLVCEVFKGLLESQPKPQDLHCPEAWLACVIANEARDASRRERAKKRGGGAEMETIQETAKVEPHLQQQPDDVDSNIDAERALNELGRLAVDGPIAGRPRLAYLGFHMARSIARRHVDEAHAQPDRSKKELEGGLLRPPAETWTRLRDGVTLPFPEGVIRHDRGRLELAFVLRSTHPGPAAAWAQADKEAVGRARDLVRKWASRGRAQVRALCRAQGGCQ